MIFELARTYHPQWTQGLLRLEDVILCHTMELSWRDNKRNVSCIPGGIYPIHPRYSQRHRNHIIIDGVRDRDYILIHPANDAKKQLRGCIAPVMSIAQDGTGTYSRVALDLILENMERSDCNNCFIKIYEASYQT